MKAELIARLQSFDEEFGILKKEHMILAKYKRWNNDSFIYVPKMNETSKSAGIYKQAREVLTAELKSLEEISAKAKHFAKSTKPDANEKYEEQVGELRQILLFEQQNLKEMYASSVDFLSTTPSKISSVEAYVSFVTNVNRLDYTIRINIGKLQGALEAYADVLSSKLKCTDETDHEGLAKISAEIDLLETAKKEFVAHVERYRDASPIVRQHIINSKEAVIPKSQEQFDLALAKLKIKVGELNQKAEAEAAKYPAKLEDDKTHDYRAASAAANALLKSLEQSGKGFYSEHGGTCLWDFKEQCRDAISEARKELKHHRG
jgi:hypothetical protein